MAQKNLDRKRVSRERAGILFSLAVENARENPVLSKRYVFLARRILEKYRLRIEKPQKDLFCRGCNSILIPGKNAALRVTRHPLGKTVKCFTCGRIKKSLLEKTKASFQQKA